VTDGADLRTKFVALLFLLEFKELKALCDPELNPGLLDVTGWCIYDVVDGDDTPCDVVITFSVFTVYLIRYSG
jgi:hypothetical protein